MPTPGDFQSFQGKGALPGALAQLVFDAYFYEWDATTSKWVKILHNDPEPPENLSPGRYDGQITEVKKTNA